MPLILVVIALIVLPAIIVLSLPLSIRQRYRAGTARRLARGWVSAFNTFSLATSAGIFLIFAGISSTWLPGAFTYSVCGLLAGCALGIAGLALSHWEATPNTLHYTPNRWLVLSITVVVAARVCFGFWRAWHAWQITPDKESWLAASGLAGSMAAGARSARVLSHVLDRHLDAPEAASAALRGIGSSASFTNPPSNQIGTASPSAPASIF